MLALALLLALPALASDTLRLTLDDALRLALRRSPARAEIQVARIQSVTRPARGIASLVPTPSVSLGWSRSEQPLIIRPDSTVTVEGWTGAFSVSQVVFDPQVFAAVATSFIQSGYHGADARDRQARLVFDVTADYLNLLKARLLRDAASSALRRADDNLELTRERFRLGSAAPFEVMRAEVFRSQAGINLLTLDKGVAAANAALLATLGVMDRAVVNPVEELTEPSNFVVSDPDSLLAEIERRSPGAGLAARASTAASIGLAGTIGRALPSVGGYFRSEFAGTVLPRRLSDWTGRDYNTVGVSLTFPLLDLKSYVLDIADASVEARRARAVAARARLSLRSAAVAAILGYREAQERQRLAEQNLALSEELARLAREQHRLGALSQLDLFSVEIDLAQSRATRIAALCDTYIQAAQISYLLGNAAEPAVRKEP